MLISNKLVNKAVKQVLHPNTNTWKYYFKQNVCTSCAEKFLRLSGGTTSVFELENDPTLQLQWILDLAFVEHLSRRLEQVFRSLCSHTRTDGTACSSEAVTHPIKHSTQAIGSNLEFNICWRAL